MVQAAASRENVHMCSCISPSWSLEGFPVCAIIYGVNLEMQIFLRVSKREDYSLSNHRQCKYGWLMEVDDIGLLAFGIKGC